MSLLRTTCDAYATATGAQPERYRVESPEAWAFSRSIQDLSRAVGEEAAQPLWSELVGSARAARWRSSVEPVPLDFEGGSASFAFEECLKAITRMQGLVDASLASRLARLQEGVLGCVGEANAALSNALLECLFDGDPNDTCVVAQSRRAALCTQAWLRSVDVSVPVLSPREFMAGRYYDFAVIVGPGDWYPGQLLTCPRAATITLLHYRHIRDSASFTGIFGDYATVPLRIKILDPLGLPELPVAPEVAASPDDAADEYMPAPAWSALLAAAPEQERGSGSSLEERLPSRLIALAEGFGMWLPVDAQTVRGLDLLAPPGDKVVSLRATGVTVGTILLAREGGTVGATLATMADRLLGVAAVAVRKRQARWKGALSQEIRLKGAPRIERELRARGSSTANVRYWASDDNIRPLKDRDFALLLDYLGQPDGGQHLADGRLLWKAHHQAGAALSDALEAVLEAADLTELETVGRQELALPDGSATMTAFRVLGVSPVVREVPAGGTRRPFKMQGAAWLE